MTHHHYIPNMNMTQHLRGVSDYLGGGGRGTLIGKPGQSREHVKINSADVPDGTDPGRATVLGLLHPLKDVSHFLCTTWPFWAFCD